MEIIKLYKDYLECVYKRNKLSRLRGIGVTGSAESFSKLEKPSLENYLKLYRVGTVYYLSFGDRYVKYATFDALDKSLNLRDQTSEFTKEWMAVENKYNLCSQSFAFQRYDENAIIQMIKSTYSAYLTKDSDDFLFKEVQY